MLCSFFTHASIGKRSGWYHKDYFKLCSNEHNSVIFLQNTDVFSLHVQEVAGLLDHTSFIFSFMWSPSYCAMPIHILTGSTKDSFFPTTLTKIVMFCLSDDSHAKQSQVVLKITDTKCTHHTHKWQLWEVIYVNKLDGTILKCLISRNCVGCDKCIHLQMLM